CASGSTGTRFSRAERVPASARRCPRGARSTPPFLRKEEDEMTMTLIADAPVEVDAEGFLTDPEQWNESIAEAIAHENRIPELIDRNWLVVRFLPDRYLATGA